MKNKKYFITTLLVCIAFFNTYAGDSNGYNNNFHNRFEYVTSFFDYITKYDDDFLLSLNVIEKASMHQNYVVIGVKELFRVLHGEPYNSKEQLYFSVGKVFLRDTLFVDSSKFNVLKNFAVDRDSLMYLNKLTFEDVISTYTIDGHIRNAGIKLEWALIFYFDRRFYPTNDPGNTGYIVDLKYDFSSSNNNSIFRGKNGFLQLWDKYGNLISESPEE